MKELITLKTTDNGNTTVSARELYLGLGLNKSHWNRWSVANIDNNDFFEEGKDYKGFAIMENGNKVSDYEITIEFAKHLVMMARTKKSHEYRNYFLECEKELKNNNQLQLQNTEISKQIAEIVQAQLKEQLQTQSEFVDNKYSYYIRPTALTKRSISDYIKRRLGIDRANDEYELVKRRILIVLGAKKWEDIPVEKLQASLSIIDECIDIAKKDRPYQQLTMI